MDQYPKCPCNRIIDDVRESFVDGICVACSRAKAAAIDPSVPPFDESVMRSMEAYIKWREAMAINGVLLRMFRE